MEESITKLPKHCLQNGFHQTKRLFVLMTEETSNKSSYLFVVSWKPIIISFCKIDKIWWN